MLDETFTNITQGVYGQDRRGASLFYLSLFKSKTKTHLTTLRELMHADDTAIIAHSLEEIALITSRLAKVAKDFG